MNILYAFVWQILQVIENRLHNPYHAPMAAITTNELREKFLAFFESKGHTAIPSAPLKPEHDPSVLFTTAGMHPLVPYLKGEAHPAGKRLTDAQKCLRTTDIDEVGDATHATVFEMLGNWSLGDYFKKEAIAWSWEFLTDTQWLGLDPNYLAVSVFGGNNDAPCDDESAEIWIGLGVPTERIAYLGADDNWWPAGGKHMGPQGPDTEMFYWTGTEAPPQAFDPADPRWVEIWNDVFMQFNRLEDGSLEDLPQKNVDTGMGLERTVMVLNGMRSIYEIDSFQPLLRLIDQHTTDSDERHRRIVADHVKAATFLLGDKEPIFPSNTDQGYVLRRLIRRAVRSARLLGVTDIPRFLRTGSELMIEQYGEQYQSIGLHRQIIQREIEVEAEKFLKTLDKGLVKISQYLQNRPDINGHQAFELFTTYGIPIEMQIEEAKKHGATIALDEFEKEMQKHRALSRTAAAGKFKGGLADHSETSIKYHTATHLLHQALRDVLGDHVFQKGSNITAERLRFDFSHPDKMAPEQITAVEAAVNAQITADLPISREEMTVQEAKDRGALGLFEQKYGESVSVYSIGDYSCEICGGPHVDRTGGLGHFRIAKEESAGAGVRRIKAVLE